jgi:hypothetical protein
MKTSEHHDGLLTPARLEALRTADLPRGRPCVVPWDPCWCYMGLYVLLLCTSLWIAVCGGTISCINGVCDAAIHVPACSVGRLQRQQYPSCVGVGPCIVPWAPQGRCVYGELWLVGHCIYMYVGCLLRLLIRSRPVGWLGVGTAHQLATQAFAMQSHISWCVRAAKIKVKIVVTTDVRAGITRSGPSPCKPLRMWES